MTWNWDRFFSALNCQSCFLLAAGVYAAVSRGAGKPYLLGWGRTFPLGHPSEKKSENWGLSWRGKIMYQNFCALGSNIWVWGLMIWLFINFMPQILALEKFTRFLKHWQHTYTCSYWGFPIMYQGLFSALHLLLFYLISMKTRELNLLIWKINIVRPSTQGLMMFIFQMSKRKLRMLNNFPKVPQQVGGRAGVWTQVCGSEAYVSLPLTTPAPS